MENMAGMTFYTDGSKAMELKSQIRMIEESSEKAVMKSKIHTYHDSSVILDMITMLLGAVFTLITALHMRA